ncbi:MAG: DUF2007 domain-containing protein [Clostridia bacterium]|nr:DUF2007 domain-containing protein [Clostridia bacterium]
MNKNKPPLEDTRLLTTVMNRIESDMIRELLKNAGIPTLVKPKYGLDRMPVLSGSSALGEELYVYEENYEEARDLLDGFINGRYTSVEDVEDGEDGEQ